MRTPSAYAIACRRANGEIVTTAESLPKWSDKYKWLSWPVLRGGATLIQSMALGVKALNFSAKIWEEDNTEKETVAEKVVEQEVALVSGTVDGTFGLAPVKVVMPTKEKKGAGQSIAAIGSMFVGWPLSSSVNPAGVFIHAFAEMMEKAPTSATNGMGTPSQKWVHGRSRRQP